MTPAPLTPHGERQRQIAMDTLEAALKVVKAMARGAELGEFRFVSDTALELSGNLADLSRMMMASDAVERSAR